MLHVGTDISIVQDFSTLSIMQSDTLSHAVHHMLHSSVSSHIYFRSALPWSLMLIKGAEASSLNQTDSSVKHVKYADMISTVMLVHGEKVEVMHLRSDSCNWVVGHC